MTITIRVVNGGYILDYQTLPGQDKQCEIFADKKDLHKKLKELLGF